MNSYEIAIKSNIPKIYAFNFFWMFLVIMPVFVPFLMSLDLNMADVFILQVILGLTIALLEIPSGYLSDLWGRKKVLVLGSLLYALAFTYLIVADSFMELAIFEILTGIAVSLVSGSDMSLLYDSVKNIEGSRAELTQVVGNKQFYSSISEAIASILGGALAVYSFKYAVYSHALVSWFPFFISLTLVEPQLNRMDKQDHRSNFKKVFRHIFCEVSLLKYIFVNLVFWGVSTYLAVWIFQKYWMEENVSLVYFGFLWAGYNFVVGVVSRFVSYFEKKLGAVGLIWIMSVLPVLGYLGLSYLSGLLGLLIGLTFQVSRGINQVLLKDAFNWRTPSEFRATANSILSLCFRLGFAVMGPVVGFLIEEIGTSLTLRYLALFFVLGLIILIYPLVKRIKEPLDQCSS